MTDTALPAPASGPRRLDVSSNNAVARVKGRYRAEARFRAYGLIALAITSAFLLTLIIDILTKGLPAFWQHSFVLNVPVAADLVDEKSRNDVQAIRAADYYPTLKATMETIVPGLESRGAQKQLMRLLSSGADDELRNAIVKDPSLIGRSVKARLLLSDDADLYYKGEGTPISSRPARGIATPSGTTGEVTILTSANDFADELVTIKKTLSDRAANLIALAGRIERRAGAEGSPQAKELREEAAGYQSRIDNPSIAEDLDSRMPSKLIAINGGLVKVAKLDNSTITGEVLLPLSTDAEAQPGSWSIVTYVTPESDRKVNDQEVAFLERFREKGVVENGFNWRFFTAGDSREPELAGVLGALIGSALTLMVTLALCLPIGVMAAIYLEEFAPKNRFTDLIEVNINNLAAVPSIVFGLLGLAVFLNFIGLPRSAPLVGGLVLALLVLPTIIIAARAALKAVPPSIKEAALGVGASHQQAIFHHVLPLAMPGIMTGTIIGMAHALGETAPLLMIGMIAFIVDVPKGFTDAATVLPVQIYLWSDLPEAAFQAKTAGAIIVLLLFLFGMNGMAIWLRKRFERRW